LTQEAPVPPIPTDSDRPGDTATGPDAQFRSRQRGQYYSPQARAAWKAQNAARHAALDAEGPAGDNPNASPQAQPQAATRGGEPRHRQADYLPVESWLAFVRKQGEECTVQVHPQALFEAIRDGKDWRELRLVIRFNYDARTGEPQIVFNGSPEIFEIDRAEIRRKKDQNEGPAPRTAFWDLNAPQPPTPPRRGRS
jgi:hypothetical protein